MSFKNKARLALNALHFPFVKAIHGKQMDGKTIVLDFSRMDGCTLKDCTVVFFGVGGFHADRCEFNNCQFVFEGPAASSLQLLTLVMRACPETAEKTFPFMRDQIIDSLQKELIEKSKSVGISS